MKQSIVNIKGLASHGAGKTSAARGRTPQRHALAWAAAACLLAQPAPAATVEWSGGSGLWSDASHWSGRFVPSAGFNVMLGIEAAPTPSVTVDFDGLYDVSSSLGLLTINSTGIAGTFTLLQTRLGSTMVANTEIIGDTIFGNVYDQRAGDNITTNLTLGNLFGGNGNYLLSGTGRLAVGAGLLTIGNAGSGNFLQSGVNTEVNAGRVQIGVATGGSGGYTLASGTVNIANGGYLQIYPGRGSWSQQGGNLNFSGSAGLQIGNGAGGATPAFTLSGGAINGANFETIGYATGSGSASFLQQAGANNLAAGGILGIGSGGSGNYMLTGGSLSSKYISLASGSTDVGTFTHIGGTVTVSAGGELDIGVAAGGSGIYTIDNQPITNGSVLSAPTIKVGVAGNGSFTQRNGSVSTSTLTLGYGSGSSGSYTMNGGGLLVGSAAEAGTVFVGLSGSASFTQTGGGVTVRGAGANEGTLQIGRTPNVSASYFLKGGGLTADRELVGTLANGSFVQSGGLNSVGGSGLWVGYSGVGSYDLSTDSAAHASLIASVETIGLLADGSFSQRGSADNQVTQALRVGAAAGASGVYRMDSIGSLDAAALQIGINGGSGSFLQNAGIVVVRAGGLQLGSLGSSGSYALGGGTLLTGSAADSFIVNASGSFTQTGGGFSGTLSNNGSFNYSGGNFGGRLDNGPAGGVNITGSLIAGAGVINRGTITVGPGSTLGSAAAASLDNEVTLTLAGGSLGGVGAIVNNASLGGFGTIAGSGGFTNNGFWSVGVGNVALANSGSNSNVGILELGAGRQLQLAGATLANAGTLALNAGLVTGSGTLVNTSGGTISGAGTITAVLDNRGLIVPGNGAIAVTRGWVNAGVVNLSGVTSGVTGGAITNTGSIQGSGMVGGAVSNGGTIEAIGGTLVLAGALGNASGGRLAAGSGGKLLVQGGLADNAGLIVLSGGTFDGGSGTTRNSGLVAGHGSFASGAWVNAGAMSFTGGNTLVNGSLTNNAGRSIEVAYNPATFSGAVINNGTLRTLSATVVFAGGFVNNGLLVSDPSTLRFSTLSVGAAGALQAAAGDRYEVSNGFVNLSNQAMAWDTHGASLLLDGSGIETLTLAGRDLGANLAGYSANFAWGRVEVARGTGLQVSSAGAKNALYAGAFVLDGGLAQIASIQSDANIYYDPSITDNAYLGGASYALAGGGMLAAAVPEPASWLLLAVGTLGLAWRRRAVRQEVR